MYGVYVTEQLPEERVQVVELKVPRVEAWPPKVTVPIGLLNPPESVSVTVAVQVLGLPAPTELGEHVTEVAVLLRYACPSKGISCE